MTRCSCSAHGSFLTAKGLEEAEQREVDLGTGRGIDVRWLSSYLDKVGSVSGVRRDETIFVDAVVEEQALRFHSDPQEVGYGS